MEKKEIIVVVLAIIVLGTSFFFAKLVFPMIFLLFGMSLNNLFNGQEYFNKTYFLLSFVIVIISALINLYNFIYLNPVNKWSIGAIWILIALMALFFVWQYKNRESNSKIQWKDEW
jgi:Ca2+/Na+ antiporter